MGRWPLLKWRSFPANSHGGCVLRHLPSEHGDFIFDARLLPLQRFFRDALDSDHLSRGLLPSHHHFRKRTAAREEEKHGRFIRTGTILTQRTLSLVRRWRALSGRQPRVHKQHIVDIYWELAKSLTVANSLQCWLMLGACVQSNTRQTLLKPVEKKERKKKATPI